jgi:hypothetical protein
MRIVWNITENWFQAELSLNENWRDDMELVRSLGLKTTGPPLWIWHTSQISLLDKLRDSRPKSGLTITEVALEKYKFLKEQSDKKQELKKLFIKAKKTSETTAADEKCKEYEDPNTGVVCVYVPPATEKFTWKYTPPVPPDVYCFVCGDPIFPYEYPDVCLWCSQTF